jgi:hypothetical protein
MDENKEQASTKILVSPEEKTDDTLTHSIKPRGFSRVSPVFSESWSWLVKYGSPHLKALVVITWMLAISIQVTFTIRDVFTQGKILGLDTSWFIGLPAAMQDNAWSGRDFYFTYGPLWQFIALLGSGLNSSGSTIDGQPGIILASTLLEIGLIGLSIGLIKQLDTRRSLIVLAVITLLNFQGFWIILRPMAAIVCALLVQRSLAAPTTRGRLTWAVAAGGAFIAAQLISADLGAYTVGGAVVTLVIFSLLSRFRHYLKQPALLAPGKYLILLAVMLGTYLAANLLLSLLFILTSPNYLNFFDYQYYNIEIILGYTYAMGGLIWELPAVSTLAIILGVIFVIGLIGANFSKISMADNYLLVCLAICSIFQLKGATVRSDIGHIALGVTPLILIYLLIGVIGGASGWYKNTFFKVSWGILAIFLLAAWPWTTIQPLKQLNALVNGSASLSQQLQKLTTGHIPASDILPPGLQEATNPSKAILSFPQDNYIPIAMNRPMVAPVLQAYSAFTEPLQQKYVAELERQKNTFEVVYGLDGLSATMLENLQQVTRVPLIFEYLYRNYYLKNPQVFDKKFVLLEPRPAPIEFMSQELAFTTQPWNGQLLTLKLNERATCSLLRLTPKINYPIFSLVGRPSQLNVKIWSHGKILQESGLFAIEPGKPFSTYISLMGQEQFYTIFSNTLPVQAKEWDSLQMLPLATAFLSISPSAVDVGKVECISFKRS